MKYFIIVLFLLFLTLSGCSSKKSAAVAVKDQGIQQEGIQLEEIEEISEEKIVRAEEKQEIEKIETPAPPIDEEKEDESIVSVIETLEGCYKTADLKKWQNLLTPMYRERHNDPEFLKLGGWSATDIESFFYLLVETRKKGNITSLPISRVEFINQNKALVYVILGDKEFPEPQHTFIRLDNRWYKGLTEEGE